MKGQYQTKYNLPPMNSKIYDKDEYSYNTNSFINSSIINYSSLKPSSVTSFALSPTENKDHFINIFDDSKKFDLYEDSLESSPSPLSSFPSSSTSSTVSLSLPSSTFSPLSPTQSPLSNDLDFYINLYRYDPLSMTIPEPKKSYEEFNSDSNTNFFSKGIIFLNPFKFHSSGKIDRTWRYLVILSIILSLLCYLNPFEAAYKFITPIKYFVTCLTVISLILRIIIMFAQNNSFKSVKSYTTYNNTSPPTYTETQQQQQDATVINMEQNDQFANNTRETQNENSAGFAKPSLCGGCRGHCRECCNAECFSIRNGCCRDCVNFNTAGCCTALCLCYS